MNKTYVLVYSIIIAGFSCFAQENLSYARQKTVGLDIELSQVAVSISLYDGESIAYTYYLKKGRNLSITETQKTLRIRQLFPVEGTLSILIPKKMLLESCLIRLNRAQLYVENVHAVHFISIMNNGTHSFIACVFKNAVINTAQGSLTIDSKIIRSCALSNSHASASIQFRNAPAKTYLDYSKTNSTLFIDTKEQLATMGFYGNPKGKTRIILSSGSSKTSVQFLAKEDE